MITKFINKKHTTDPPDTITLPNEKINIFYENQMNPQSKKDEKILKDIIKKNFKPANNTHEINTIIYYKILKDNNLIMYNDLTKDTDISSKSHAVYEVLCPIGGCALPNPLYIGQTRTM